MPTTRTKIDLYRKLAAIQSELFQWRACSIEVKVKLLESALNEIILYLKDNPT